MRWISRQIRDDQPTRVSITVAGLAAWHPSQLADSIRSQHAIEQWHSAFSALDSRNLPATWAVVESTAAGPRAGFWKLGHEMVASPVRHELAFRHRTSGLDRVTGEFAKHVAFADQLQLPLRTFVTDAVGIHPAVLSKLGVHALVTVPPGTAPSRTGSLRAIAWDTWRAPITNRIESRSTSQQCKKLNGRLCKLLDSTHRLHLLLLIDGPPSAALLHAFDEIADYARRGWVIAETIGQAAEAETGQSQGRVAA